MTRFYRNTLGTLTLVVGACATDLPTTPPASRTADTVVAIAAAPTLALDEGAALGSAAADALERIMPAFPYDPRTDALRSALRQLAALSQTHDADSLAGAASAAGDELTQLQQRSETQSEVALYLGVIQLVVSRAASLGAAASGARPVSAAPR